MNPSILIASFLAYADKLKFRNLFLIVISLFTVDLFVPDFIPLIDEIILGLLAIILANWKKERGQKEEGNLIEGEFIDEDNKQ
jgi:uncharacterized protein DUF6116